MIMSNEGELRGGEKHHGTKHETTLLHTSANPPQFYTPLDSIRCIEIPHLTFCRNALAPYVLPVDFSVYSCLSSRNERTVADCYLNLWLLVQVVNSLWSSDPGRSTDHHLQMINTANKYVTRDHVHGAEQGGTDWNRLNRKVHTSDMS